MTNEDVKPFKNLMLKLAAQFEQPLLAPRLFAYFEALQDLTLDEVERGIAEVRRRHVVSTLPTVGEIRLAACESVEEEAERAWGEVVGNVKRYGYVGVTGREERPGSVAAFTQHPPPFTDPLALQAVVHTAGSWERLCELLPLDNAAGFVGLAKQFRQVYLMLAKRRRVTVPLIEGDSARAALDEAALDEVRRVRNAESDGEPLTMNDRDKLRVVGGTQRARQR